MVETVHLEFASLPSALGLLPKLLLLRRPVLVPDQRELPRIEVSVAAVRSDAARVSRYNAICGYRDAESLSITYPHVLASPLHLALLGSDAFPVRALGLVHLANSITQYSPIPVGETVGLHCHLEGYRDTDRGHEFDLTSEVRSGESVLWEEVTTFLARRSGARAQAGAAAAPPEPELTGASTVSFQVPADIGRRYALVSGDFNPIHLSMPTARLFGFPKAIAHGMWSLARCVAEISDAGPAGKIVLECAFKLPVLLPSWVMLRYGGERGEMRFELRDNLGEKPHLIGRLLREKQR